MIKKKDLLVALTITMLSSGVNAHNKALEIIEENNLADGLNEQEITERIGLSKALIKSDIYGIENALIYSFDLESDEVEELLEMFEGSLQYMARGGNGLTIRLVQ
ncbi:MAG: hypothetical protein ISR65_17550 [Bacteriovoracaceae bacterium]|nr:hypothetical protein [Bacteriovoracaceae bacterium]